MDKNKENPELETEVEVEAEAEAKVEAEAKKDADQAVALPADDAFAVDEAKKKNTKLPVIIAVIAVLVIAVGCIIYFAVNSGKDKNGTGEESTTAASEHASGETADSFGLSPEQRKKLIDEVVTDQEGRTISREQMSILSEVTTRMASDVGTQSAIVVDAGNHDDSDLLKQLQESSTVTVTQPNTADKQQADAAVEQIKAFMNLTFYMDGAFYGGGMGTATEMAVRGEDYEIVANMDGIEIAIMKLKDKLYMKRIATHQYVELSASVMSFIGMSPEDLAIPLERMDFDKMSPVAVYDATIGGAKGVCYTYAQNDTLVKFYSVDGNLKQIEILDANGTVASTMDMNVFSTSIPADMFTLKGYQPAAIGDMLADVMAAQS